MSVEVERVLERLDGVRSDGSGWSARCPCRQDDHNPSLHIGEGIDGRVLLTCHRGGGCDLEGICEALKLSVADLHPVKLGGDEQAKPKSPRASRKPDGGAKPAVKAGVKQAKPRLTLVDTYVYHDAQGTEVFQKLRYVDAEGRKTFRQRRRNPDRNPDGGGNSDAWVYNLTGIDQPLYRLPWVLAAKANHSIIWIVEGEKDAETLVALGLEATTMNGGAGKWRDDYSAALAGADCYVIADNDAPGLAHAAEVARSLREHLATVTCYRPPDGHKDVTDMVDAGVDLDDLVAWEPAAPAAPAEPLATPTVAQDPGETRPEGLDTPELLAEHLTVAGSEADTAGDTGADGDWDDLLDAVESLLADEHLSHEARITKATRLLTRALPDQETLTPTVLNWSDFVHGDDEPYEWIIPGVLERGERVMVVAEEGAGKTFLMRQVALCAAAGIHPFTKSAMPALRTLTIDLENPERIIRRTSREIVRSITTLTQRLPDQAHLVIRPQGLNLLKEPDRRFLEAAIEEAEPDLVCMGPIYKSFVDPGGRTSEAIAVEVAKYLDELRADYGFSWWLEHHAPLGDSMRSRDLRPFGSAVWSRWPEFGLALAHDPTESGAYVYEIKHFRGARDARQWPVRMKRGGKGNLPFEVMEFMRTD